MVMRQNEGAGEALGFHALQRRLEVGELRIADRVVGTITDTFLQLSKHPNLGRRRDDIRKGLRSINAGSYVIIYRVERINIRILHVVHGRRDIKSAIRH